MFPWWVIPIMIGGNIASSAIASRGGGSAPSFNYMPGMEQFWQQFQERLKNPPPTWYGLVSPEKGGLPPALLEHLSSSPFPMWGQQGLPFLQGQQQAALQRYGAGQQQQQGFANSMSSMGAALAMMLALGGGGSGGLINPQTLVGLNPMMSIPGFGT